MSRERRLEIQLERNERTPAAARRALQEFLADDELLASQLPMLTLLVSEVVTNAVMHPPVHSGAQVELKVLARPELTRVVVSDEGEGFSPAQVGPRAAVAPGGYGLRLLEASASRWGTSAADGRFSVWFELDRGAGGSG